MKMYYDELSSDSDGSSLPDLIIEPEPSIPDKHDHSPEFYVGLEKRMLLLHRQLFGDKNTNRLPTHTPEDLDEEDVNTEDKIQVSGFESDEDHSTVEANRQNKTTEITGVNSSDEESFEENLEPIAHSSISEDVERVDVMRVGRDSGVMVSWLGETEEASPALALETGTSAVEPENVPTDLSEISASSPRDNKKIIDDFWSLSSFESDFDSLSNKRRSESESSEDEPERKKRNGMGTETRKKVRNGDPCKPFVN